MLAVRSVERRRAIDENLKPRFQCALLRGFHDADEERVTQPRNHQADRVRLAPSQITSEAVRLITQFFGHLTHALTCLWGDARLSISVQHARDGASRNPCFCRDVSQRDCHT